MAEIESFTLDHNKVIAPYVRKITVESGPKGDKITNFDLRFVQPNKEEIATAAIHTFEHLLADLMRDEINGIIDISPFGCRTGFHLLIWGEVEAELIAKTLKKVLTKIALEIQWEDVKATTAKECGNYKDHSLFSAKEWAKIILEKGISIDAFERKLV